jgi:biopolymer transport protein ExbB
MKRSGTLVLLLLALFAAVAPAPAAAWWNNDWSLRQKVTINAPLGTEDVTRVPVLVRLHSGILDFSRVKRDGSDLRFIADDDRTPLNFHIERFDPAAELALIWVDMPKLPRGAAGGLWLYYGNSAAAKASNAAASYDANNSLVLQFSEADGKPADQSANQNTLTAFTGQLVADGLIGGGAALQATSQIVIAPSASLMSPANAGFTWSAWIRPASTPESAVQSAGIFTKGGPTAEVRLDLRNRIPTLLITRQGVTVEATAPKSLEPGSWTHLAIVVGPNESRLFIDGKAVGVVAGAVPSLDSADIIGAVSNRPGFVGTIDEVVHANVARSPALIAFAAQSQSRNAAVVSLTGKPESPDSASNGYLGILLAALTPDAWVVIGILAIMFVLSAWVMYTKYRQISTTTGANLQFIDRYRAATRSGTADDWRLIEDEKVHGQSSLFRLFRAGRREIADALPGQTLSPQSIDVVRSAMFAELTQETQSLSRSMVILTIAISGGPFLGLLGTVVGVMITFAAIAAAGDVNINSIAPGIAAALLATVAGLAVAIPSLFGYNYLVLRIRNINNDMAVFVEEFVARTAKAFS